MKKITAIIIIATFLSLVIYDLYVYLTGGEGVTISWVYMHWVMQKPWLIAAPSYLFGHLTWPQSCPKCSNIKK